MTSGTAAVSWGDGRIDLFWMGPDDALLHRAFDGPVGRRRVPRRDAGLGAGGDRLGGRPAPGLRHLRRRPALEPLLGRPVVARLGEPRWRLDPRRRRPPRPGAPTGSTSGRPASTGRPGIAGGTARAGSTGSSSRAERAAALAGASSSSSRHGPVVWFGHERHRHHPHHDDHLPRRQDRRRMACRADARAVPRPPPEGHRARLHRRPLGRAPGRAPTAAPAAAPSSSAPTPSSSRAPAGRASSRRPTPPPSRPRRTGRSS